MILRILTRLLVLPRRSGSALRGALNVILRRASDSSVLLCRILALRMYKLLTGLLILLAAGLIPRLLDRRQPPSDSKKQPPSRRIESTI